MPHTAKLFMNGRSQAVRLPAEFRFEGKEVSIRKDPKTGDVILSRQPKSLERFFQMLDEMGPVENFMKDLPEPPPDDQEIF